jgi:hypothetical protein
MFNDLYNNVSLLLSWRWPKVEGVITAIDAQGIGEGLAILVRYQFSVGEDGPYTGESQWRPGYGES